MEGDIKAYHQLALEGGRGRGRPRHGRRQGEGHVRARRSSGEGG